MKHLLILTGMLAIFGASPSAFSWPLPVNGTIQVPVLSLPSLSEDPTDYEGSAKTMSYGGVEFLVVTGQLKSAISNVALLEKCGAAAALYHPTDTTVEMQDNMTCTLELDRVDFVCNIPVGDIKLTTSFPELEMKDLRIGIWLVHDFDVAGTFSAILGDLFEVEEEAEAEVEVEAEDPLIDYAVEEGDPIETNKDSTKIDLPGDEIDISDGIASGGSCSMISGNANSLGFFLAFLALLPLAIGRKR